MVIIENSTEDQYELIYNSKNTIVSGIITKLIPTKPKFLPSVKEQKEAIRFLATKFPNNEIRSVLTRDIRFVDCGENFESVYCNNCKFQMKVQEWQDAMNKAFLTTFTELTFITTCCNKQTNLNDLDYQMKVGFSKYVIEINEINIKRQYLIDILNNLNKILNQEMKMIIAKY